jgi:regulatory protein
MRCDAMLGRGMDGEAEEKPEGRRTRGKPPPRFNQETMERAALAYLERFACSAEQLRRVLWRRARLAAAFHGDDPNIAQIQIAALIDRYRQCGLLDDARYAEMKTACLRRRGASAKAVRARLSTKGVAAEIIAASLAEPEAQNEDHMTAELAAGVAYARRRRLGSFRSAPCAEAGRVHKDMAAMARAGFSAEVARRALAFASVDPACEDEDE